MFKSKKVLIALAIVCCLTGMIFAQSRNQINNEKAKYVLSKILASRNKMRNLQFEVEHIVWQDRPARAPRSPEDSSIKIPITRQRRSETIHSLYSIVMDCNGLEKRIHTQYKVDSLGTKIPNSTHLAMSAWNGDTGVEYDKDVEEESPGAALLDNSSPHILKNQFQPWRVYTGGFAKRLAEAIEAQTSINVETLPDGKYRVSYYSKRLGNEYVGIIDPEKGFSCTLQTTFRDGIDRGYGKAEYEEFADGVWFPVEAEHISKSPKGDVVMRGHIKTSNIKVNDPNFNEDLFHVDLPEGTRVHDKISGLRYVVGDSMSITTSMDGITPNKVAMDMLKEISEQNVQIEIFIPNVEISIKKREPFVLDFLDGKLLNPKKKSESEESNKFLTELGKGDIAWDDKIVTVRGATALTTKQQANQPLKTSKGKWSISYELPDKVEFPYSILVVTKENQTYLMNIIKIETDGIRINYRKLNPDEISLYKPVTVDN